MKSQKPDFVFSCRKCGHLLFTPNVIKLLETDCPNCGEKSYANWILKRKGNYDEEYEQKAEAN